VFYREIEVQRRMLSRAIMKINGKPIESVLVLERFISSCQPAIVNAMWNKFHELRRAQELAVARAEDEIKKKQEPQSSESDGNSPSSSEPSPGTSDSEI